MKRANRPGQKKIKPSGGGDDGSGGFEGGQIDDLAKETEPDEATITHGPYVEKIPIVGMTVADVQAKFKDRYNLPDDGLVMLDGNEASNDSIIAKGQTLTFMHKANAKG